MDFLEKISTFILQVASSSYSWCSIIASGAFSFILGYIHYSHGTILSMSDTITNIITWMFLISLYLLIHKTCSSIGELILAFREQRKNEAAIKKQQEQDKNTMLNLSPREFGLLKFMLSQDCNAAWLPPNATPVIFLSIKNCIKQLDYLDSKTITTKKGSFSVSLFAISDNVIRIIANMPPEIAEKWRNSKTDKSFAKYQRD